MHVAARGLLCVHASLPASPDAKTTQLCQVSRGGDGASSESQRDRRAKFRESRAFKCGHTPGGASPSEHGGRTAHFPEPLAEAAAAAFSGPSS